MVQIHPLFSEPLMSTDLVKLQEGNTVKWCFPNLLSYLLFFTETLYLLKPVFQGTHIEKH